MKAIQERFRSMNDLDRISFARMCTDSSMELGRLYYATYNYKHIYREFIAVECNKVTERYGKMQNKSNAVRLYVSMFYEIKKRVLEANNGWRSGNEVRERFDWLIELIQKYRKNRVYLAMVEAKLRRSGATAWNAKIRTQKG